MIDIKSKFKTYTVDFINDLSLLFNLNEQKESFFVIDRNVYDLYRKELPDVSDNKIVIVESEEVHKNIDTVLMICEKMTTMSSKRNTHLISIGGGIIQDITGFVASSLYRGIKWTFFPSTLLASCDSCIGGKSSLNYKGFKNLLGSFYPPDEIKIYPNFFKTLTSKDYCSGLGEVVKFNVIAGNNRFDMIEKDIDDILQHDYSKLVNYVETSLLFKKKFIEEDEFDKGIRVLLNFAHTFGHAIEVSSDFIIPHGSAVAMGMVVANDISEQRGYLEHEYVDRIKKVCIKILHNIIVKKEWLQISNLLPAIHKDKKQTGDNITAVLMTGKDSISLFNDIKKEEIEDALNNLSKLKIN